MFFIFIYVKNIGKIIGKSITKNLNGKYTPGMLATHRKLVDHAKQFATDAVKTASKKAAEVTGDLIGNNSADEIKKKSQEFYHRMAQMQ